MRGAASAEATSSVDDSQAAHVAFAPVEDGQAEPVSAVRRESAVPFPPEPAVMAISIAATRFSSPPPIGPQAKVMLRFFSATVCQSRGKT